MEKITAIYNGLTVYIHYVSKFKEYVLASYEKDESRKFKATVADLSSLDEAALMNLLREQELKEQSRR